MKEKKIGVFLSRMQPLHNGHLGMIDKILKENDKIAILIGSSNKSGTIRNPIEIKFREKILKEALEENFGEEYKEKIVIKKLPDWTSEDDIASNLEWGRYLYYNIVSVFGIKDFAIYFSDEPEIIEDWFQDQIIKKRVSLRMFKRNEMFNAISSTKIRNAFLNDDKDYIEKSVPNSVIKRYEQIKKIIDKVYTESNI